MKKVSVIIPCFNVERYISSCLDSVLCQTYQNFEIICINDGSTDNSLKILLDYQSKYPDLITIINETNKGASKARNRGLELCSGEFLQFLDADDIITVQKFEMQVNAFSDSVDVVISDREHRNEDLSLVISRHLFSDIGINPLETAITKIITTCNPLYRTKMVKELQGYNENIRSCQDWDFHLRMVLKNYRIKYVPGVFFINRKVEGSLSSNWVKVFIQSTFIISNFKEELCKSPFLNETIRTHLAGIYFNSAIYCEKLEDAKKYAEEMKFWNADYPFNSVIKGFIGDVFGYYALIRILRLFKKQTHG